MKRVLLFCILLLSVFCTSCSQNKFIPLYTENKPIEETALLTIPVEIDLIYHNGLALDDTPPYQPFINYRLTPGKHVFGFRYQEIHLDEENTEEVVTSQKAYIHFIAKQGDQYALEYDKPESFIAAKKFEKAFQIKLMENSQLITLSIPTPESDITLTHIENKNKDEKEDVLKQLKYWWGNASEDQKQLFTKWAELDD